MLTGPIWLAVTRQIRDWTPAEVAWIQRDLTLQQDLLAWYQNPQSRGCWTSHNQTLLKRWQALDDADADALLERYVALRWQLVELDAQRRQLEVRVADIGLTARNPAGNSKFYRSPIADLSVGFRTQKPQVTGNADLESLQEDIELEALKARRQNAERLAALQAQVEEMQAAIERLSQTDLGRQYQQEFDARVAALTVKVPQVKVHFR